MKIFIIAAFVAFVATVNAEYTKEIKAEHTIFLNECRDIFEITEEQYLKLRHGEVPDANENMQCLTDCFMHKVGVLKGGELEKVGAGKFLNVRLDDMDKVNGILKTCSGESGPKKCETAFKLHQCFIKTKAY